MFNLHQLHTRRVNPINSQLQATGLSAIELVDSSLPILTPLEDDNAEVHADFTLAATNVIPEPGNVPHQQRPERAEEVLKLPHPEARRQVAHAYETPQELAMILAGTLCSPTGYSPLQVSPKYRLSCSLD
jgi:hypothetical protein